MEVATVTTADRSLLHAVRATLDGADRAFLCVAFVQERGLHLLGNELEDLKRRSAPARLLVTTTFETTTGSALAMARGLGLDVRGLNPGSGKTFHPKLYLAESGHGETERPGNDEEMVSTNTAPTVSVAGW
jgi:HKD family nuclease